MKHIFKSMMAQRRRNIWLFLEMIIVSVVTWVVIDPVMVLLSIGSWPHGYDQDRLVYMEVGLIKPSSSRYSEEAADSAKMKDAFNVILNRIKSIPDVESVTPISTGMRLDGGWSSQVSMSYTNEEGDTLRVNPFVYSVPVNMDYFTTYGIKAADGSPSAAELSNISMAPTDIIITESLAVEMFGDGGSYIGRTTAEKFEGMPDGRRVVGVVEDVRPWQSKGVSRVMWYGNNYNINDGIENTAVAVRISDATSPSQWIADHGDNVRADSYVGNLYIKYVSTYADAARSTWQERSAKSEKRLKIVLLIFFLVNLSLGVVGTFYLQTRQRSRDAGIMKSFGATCGNIFRNLTLESMLITFAGWLIGCLLYLNYAFKEGLSAGIDWNMDYLPKESWIVDFWTHYAIVSLTVLVILLIIVFFGVSMPARRISRIDPVTALREK